jgi:hypothetical protein
MTVIKRNTSLPCFKTEAFAGFQKKFLQMIDDGLFELCF